MPNYTRCGPYVLTETVQDWPYGRLARAVRTEGFAYMEHLLVLALSDSAPTQALAMGLDQSWDWLSQFDRVRKIEPLKVFHDEDALRLALPFMIGRPLAEIIQRNATERLMRTEHFLPIAHDLAVALTHLHEAGLHHGALSLDTTWLDIEGSVRLMDAPLGKILIEAELQTQALGALAPHKQHFALNWANDQESLGLILYHLISGAFPTSQPDLASEVEALCFLQDEWSDQPPTPAHPSLRRIILRAIQAEYGTPRQLLADILTLYHDDTLGSNPTAFDAAYLLQMLFRDDLQIEQGAIENEKNQEFVEHIGEPKIIVEERIIEIESAQRRRRRLIRASIAIALSLVVGGGFLVRARRDRQQQQQTKSETDTLLARFKQNEAAYKSWLTEQMGRIATAKTAEEKAAILAEIEQRKAVYEAEQAAIRQTLERLKAPQVATLPPTTPPPSATQPSPVATAPTTLTPAPSALAENLANAKKPTEKPLIVNYDPAVPYSPSAKAPIGAPDPIDAPIQEPAPLPSRVKAEVLQTPTTKSANTPGTQAATATPAPPPPDITLKERSASHQVKKLVIPPLDAARLKEFAGQTVRIRVIIDPFGNPRTASIEQCPPSLAADFRAAAMQTRFNPSLVNGRAVQGTVYLEFQLTGSGVEAR